MNGPCACPSSFTRLAALHRAASRHAFPWWIFFRPSWTSRRTDRRRPWPRRSKVRASSRSPAGKRSERRDTVYAELSAEGSTAPCVMVRRGRHKFIHCETDPPLLFDLVDDPTEQTNLATRPKWSDLIASFQSEVDEKWDLKRWRIEVEKSLRQRILIHETYEKSNPPIWDYAVNDDPSRLYMRSFREPWQDTERKATLK